MKYKIVAVDLDGTLLRKDKTISENTYNVLESVSKLGVEIVPCTGRLYNGMPDCVRNLPFVNYCICANGAVVYDVKNKTDLCNYALSCNKALEIMDKLSDIDMLTEVYINGKAYMNKNQFEKVDGNKYIGNPVYIEHTKNFVEPVEDVYSLIKDNNLEVQKFLFLRNEPKVISNLVDFVNNNIDDCVITSSAINDAELNHPNATKGKGLMFLADFLRVSMDDTIALGDGGNDVSMLLAAGLGIAPANAREMAKEASDMQTLSCDEDGVAYALNALYFKEK